ncbi:flagellar brake protein [Thauera linaloolentis]|uniref:Flagellar brake protein YcgR n=1 Tax=Thauera linaloolentis (strain DSM 12138 / JCM 21573 / CCUG 41526 / CIP 105981 / IAM 15112 / NBRC 102519 / 47Lol) TaxID=1123367 RepID=N6Z028_THAL4|nr:flagellar brake protein [Thauera linaloolentis]ENO87962.1 type IV pilus assembly PilZ [Thauera linaloolentis 47Lol = DSM 12138]MCM8567101.1 flagellar brake protein [Thauera linaloolentis]
MTIEHELTRVELLQADDASKYLLKDDREILFIMRRLVDARSLLSARGEPGYDSFLTALLQISSDGSTLILDGSPDAALNARLEQAERLDCVTQLDKVRIQFMLDRPVFQTWREGPAFSAALPGELLRLQRREFYRLQAPVTHSLTCTVPLPHAGELALRIIDISGGGIAIAVPPADAPFAPGDEFAGCRITLPDSPPISARLIVRNLFRLTTRNGVEMLRAGCEFSDMPRGADEAIQRYILRIERERNARQHTLG